MMEAIVLVLLAQMEDRSFKKREKATTALATLQFFYDVRPLLKNKGLKHADAEVRKRVSGIISDYESVKPSVVDYYPRLDFLPHANDDRLYEQCNREVDLTPFCWNHWYYAMDVHYRACTENYAYGLFQQGKSRWEVARILDAGIRVEKKAGINPLEKPAEVCP
jgi:hypothetical protein